MKLKVIFMLVICLFLIGVYVMIESNVKLQNTEEYSMQKFDLRDKIELKPEYQIRATYHSCYAYATLDSIETYLLLQKGKEYNFSEAHVEYMTSNLLGGKRSLNSGGSFYDVINYIKEGKGPALEKDIPNREYSKKEYSMLKKYIKAIFKDIQTVHYVREEENVRDKIKQHIAKNGSLVASIYFSPKDDDYYNSSTYAYCNLKQKEINHAISIIGWDDNYPKENFNKENRPKEHGAYIAMAYWKEEANEHVLYISYEDCLVEEEIIGIQDCILY